MSSTWVAAPDRRCCLQAAPRGLAALPRAGAAPASSRSYQRSPLQVAALAARLPLVALQWATATCGLATADYPLRLCRGQQALGGIGCSRSPFAGGLAATGRPLAGGPWLQTNAPLQVVDRPCKGAGRGHARLPLVRASFSTKM
ncbi:hypothetical protein BHM03_00035084 [Ensete ventricosum]|nr:hypothetical protein BHM03_00035084 [Ensete ventricosum]